MGPRILRDVIDSTQSQAIADARAGATAGTRIVARRQTGGSGRSGRRWASPLGGLYLSEILAAPPIGRALLPLAVGAEISQAFAMRYGVHTLVKWPNDLLVATGHRPRKLAGILCDAIAAPWGQAVVVGVGVNVAAPLTDFPPDLRPRVAALSELTAPSPGLEDVENEVVSAIERAEIGLRSEPGRNRLLRLCREALYGLGRRARVDGRPFGIIRGLGEDGALLLGDGVAQRVVHAGNVSVEESA